VAGSNTAIVQRHANVQERCVITPETLEKRRAFTSFVEEALAPYPAVQGVVGIGSIATGRARPESDIDAVVFLDPFDPYIVPAEAFWRRADGSFHSIFSDAAKHEADGLFLDMQRFDLRQWADPAFTWPEGRLAELGEGWLVFDRGGAIERLTGQRLAYPDSVRLARLDDAVTWMDQNLRPGKPERVWERLGPAIAHDRLHASYDYMIQALFALNWRWRPWRNREMSYLLALPWLPERFDQRVLTAMNAPSLEWPGYIERVKSLRQLFGDLLTRLSDEGVYTEDPIGEAFVRSHPEIGRAWNMDAWNRKHVKRKLGGSTHG
jgi:hypothetical protein